MFRHLRPLFVTGLLALVGLLVHGCSTCPVRHGRYGPNTYDTEGAKFALVSITDTNYPALLRGQVKP